MRTDVRRRQRRYTIRPPRIPKLRDPAHADLWACGFDDEIHQPVRFLIMSVLRRSSPAGLRFGTIRDRLRLTDGNLSGHLDRLERLEYIIRLPDDEARRRYTLVRLTAAGRRAYARHVAALADLATGWEDHG